MLLLRVPVDQQEIMGEPGISIDQTHGKVVSLSTVYDSISTACQLPSVKNHQQIHYIQSLI